MPTGSDGGPAFCDLLVKNAHVLTLDDRRTVYPHGAVAISGRDLVGVGPEREVLAAYRARRVIDAHGAVVHPGFVESHYHTTLHLTRGTISDAPHAVSPSGGDGDQIGLYSAWFNALHDDDEYAGALLASVEMVRNGITCFMEPGTAFETDAVAAAAQAVGIRASLCDPFLWDHTDGLAMTKEVTRAPATIEQSLELLGRELRRNSDPDALVCGHVGLYGMGTCSDELAVAAKRCADEHGTVLTLHQNFDSDDVEYDDERFGRHGVAHLDELGVLGANTMLAHMNFAPRRRGRGAGALGRRDRLAPGQLPVLRHRVARAVARGRAGRGGRAGGVHDRRRKGLVVRRDGLGRLPRGAHGRRLTSRPSRSSRCRRVEVHGPSGWRTGSARWSRGNGRTS